MSFNLVLTIDTICWMYFLKFNNVLNMKPLDLTYYFVFYLFIFVTYFSVSLYNRFTSCVASSGDY